MSSEAVVNILSEYASEEEACAPALVREGVVPTKVELRLGAASDLAIVVWVW